MNDSARKKVDDLKNSVEQAERFNKYKEGISKCIAILYQKNYRVTLRT